MAEITAGMIKELRERTGVGMGKCKEALVEANGDMELAISNLRKAGMASAVKKEGRTTNEGKISISSDNQVVGIVEVNAETDFVANNAMFNTFLNDVAEEIVKKTPASVEALLAEKSSKKDGVTIDEYRASVVQAIGENIQVRRLAALKKDGNKSIGVYSHLGGKVVTAVEIEGSTSEEELAKTIAMHIAAASPEFLSPEQVPANVRQHEEEIARGQVAGKPANIVDKIIAGKLETFYKDHCLLKQAFIRDESVTIADLVAKRAQETGKPLKIVNFLRWSVGEKA